VQKDRIMANHNQDYSTVRNAQEILGGKKKNIAARLLPFLGPAFIASIAYVDPGNFATNIQAGAKLGYTLLWVIVASNVMAMVLQTLSAKLGIATGKNLAELCRERYSKPIVFSMWILMEVVAIATDLAEFIGAAVGFNLLFGIPLFIGGLLTALATFLILGLERYGFRPLEAVITALLGIIAGCYLVELIIGKPDWGDALAHAFLPQFQSSEGVLLAAGILGATVMPHAIFLHSALTQGRIRVKDNTRLRKLFHFEIIDVILAMGVAGLVNAAILIMAAATFFKGGLTEVGTLEQAHKTLEPLLGHTSSWVFALSLLISGLSSSSVGTSAGQVIMQGFLKKHIPVWLRRFVTVFPSLIVITLGFDPTRTLVISQVVLSFGLPFAVIPLVYFTSHKKIMGVLVNKRITIITAIVVAALIIILNLYLIYDIFAG
jgi:manganese transport protein